MKRYLIKFKSFLWKMNLAKVAKFHTNPYNVLACLPNPYKLSILGDICRACHFPLPNTSIRRKDSKMELIFHLNILVFQTNGKQPY